MEHDVTETRPNNNRLVMSSGWKQQMILKKGVIHHIHLFKRWWVSLFVKGFTSKKWNTYKEGLLPVDEIVGKFGSMFTDIKSITNEEYDVLINYVGKKGWIVWKKNFEAWKENGMEFVESD